MTSLSQETWKRWKAGLCPCCGETIDEYVDGTKPQAIGEGVTVCGRCVAMDHGNAYGIDVWALILEAIARRDDAPLTRAWTGAPS